MPDAAGPLVGWVCGYGSLAGLTDALRVGERVTAPVWGLLRGHRRDWGVAMDNAARASDPKHYAVAATGERFDGCVAFLDVQPAEGVAVGALAVPVDAARLEALDAREVNYERCEVTGHFGAVEDEPLGATVWTYRGQPEARRRRIDGDRRGEVVVSAAYLEGVEAAFAAQPPSLPPLNASTVPPGCPVAALRLVAPPTLRGY